MIKQNKKNRKVFVAMSGGVDSSVAALLLKNEGYQVTGVFMKCYNVDGCAEKDAEDARRVAEKIGIPFYVFDFESDYKKEVVEYMVREYAAGRTPNPDVMCNKKIKFGFFLKRALNLGADYVATGHYVRLRQEFPVSGSESNIIYENFSSKVSGSLVPEASDYLSRSQDSLEDRTPATSESPFKKDSGILSLSIARDRNKDQSYFLWTLTQEQLKHCLFPLGDYLKKEVREIARKNNLPTAEKKDSQGICFLGAVDLSEFLIRYITPRKGNVVTTEGEKIGEHKGVFFYTIGQRHGLGLSHKSKPEPYYVAEKDVKTNTVVVAEGRENPFLYKKEMVVNNVNFIGGRLSFPVKVRARIRYRQPLADAVIYNLGKGEYKLVFDLPVQFVSAGQSAVFYNKEDVLLGGGVIK